MLRPLLALCAVASALGFASVPAEVPAEQSKLCIELIGAAAVDSPSDDNTGVDKHELLKGAQVLREAGCPVADNDTLQMSFAEAEALTDGDDILGDAEIDAFLADGSPAKQEEVRKCLQDRLEKNGCDYADPSARGPRATRQESVRRVIHSRNREASLYAGTRDAFISNEMPYRFVALRAVLGSFDFIQCSKANGFWWEQTEASKTKWTRFTSNSDARLRMAQVHVLRCVESADDHLQRRSPEFRRESVRAVSQRGRGAVQVCDHSIGQAHREDQTEGILRGDGVRLLASSERDKPAERAEIFAEILKDRSRAAEHAVSDKDGALLLEKEAYVVGRVAGCVDHA